jgi:hypothetical protein
VPTILGLTVDDAKEAWKDAGFNPSKLDVTVGTDNYIVGHEFVDSVAGIWDGTVQDCSGNDSFRMAVAP